MIAPVKVIVLFRLLSIAVFFLIRHPASITAGTFERGVSYVSTVLPMFYAFTGINSTLLVEVIYIIPVFVLGEALSTAGVLALGRNFGISPAKRTMVKEFPYNVVKHPIYTGYVLVEGSILVLSYNIPTLSLFLLSTGLYVYRAKKEEALIKMV